MTTYLLAYHGGGRPETEEQQRRVMTAWASWYGELGSAVVDPGNPVGRTKTVDADRAVSDGGGANPVSGYTIIAADSLDEAVERAKGCPILSGGGTVEVCETFAVM